MTATSSPLRSTSDPADPNRRIELNGCFNFRDVGGYLAADGRRVRWRRLFRSDALAQLDESDLAQLRPLGIASIIDLRAESELAEDGLGPLHAEQGVLHLRAPLLDRVDRPAAPQPTQMPDLVTVYANILANARPAIGRVFTHLASDTAYPAVIHCAAGKDRTGITIALVLRALGVSDTDIAADYALTDGYLAAHVAALRAAGTTSRLDRVPPELLRAEAKTITAALAAVDEEHGTTASYLATCGITSDSLQALNNCLLE